MNDKFVKLDGTLDWDHAVWVSHSFYEAPTLQSRVTLLLCPACGCFVKEETKPVHIAFHIVVSSHSAMLNEMATQLTRRLGPTYDS